MVTLFYNTQLELLVKRSFTSIANLDFSPMIFVFIYFYFLITTLGSLIYCEYQ